MILKGIKSILQVFFERKRLKGKVKIHNNCIINHSIFEGNNTVYKDSIVVNSYIGLGTYIGDGSHFTRTKVGRFCSIAENVKIVLGKHPSSIFVSSFPAFYYDTTPQIGFSFHKSAPIFDGLNKYPEGETEYQVVIGNDVWIGCNCLIMGGVKIGDGAIVGAGAVVTKDVPPFSVVVGIPAKVKKFRFTDEQIQMLNRIKWWNWSVEVIEKNYEYFSDVDIFCNHFKGDCKL